MSQFETEFIEFNGPTEKRAVHLIDKPLSPESNLGDKGPAPLKHEPDNGLAKKNGLNRHPLNPTAVTTRT